MTHARLDATAQSTWRCTFRLVALVIALTGTAGTLAAQDRPRHGRLFPPEELGVLEGPDRDAWQMPDAVMDALGIADGSAVADIGAGGGWFTVRLARRVGPNGIVYAQDLQSQMIEAIRRRVDRDGLKNVRTVQGDDLDPRLPGESVDAILVVDTYPSSEIEWRSCGISAPRCAAPAGSGSWNSRRMAVDPVHRPTNDSTRQP